MTIGLMMLEGRKKKRKRLENDFIREERRMAEKKEDIKERANHMLPKNYCRARKERMRK